MTKERQLLALKILGGAILAGALLAFPLVFKKPFPQRMMILIFMNALLAEAWNILGGYAGQVSLGHAVFFGLGAYTSSFMLIQWGITPWLGMVVGILIAVVVSIIIGYPCFRLGGHYFVIATIAAGEIVAIIFLNWKLMGGAIGLFLPLQDDSLLHFQFSSKAPYYYIILAMLVVTVFIAYWIERTRLGFYFRAIKNDPDAARSLGIDLTKYKLMAMIISAALTAMAGTFYAQYVLFIDPHTVLPLMLSIQMCLIPVLGGTGTIAGPIIGSIILIPMAEYTRVQLAGKVSGLHLLIYGFLIMVIAVFQPAGLMGLVQRYRRRG
ncbi:MAG: branched-chain amino acid ABC transporter permease [Anaerolineales bacterium]|nr:MAG: branched-chain amino acid ABC transporter permease [Anaerolineales bacterium]